MGRVHGDGGGVDVVEGDARIVDCRVEDQSDHGLLAFGAGARLHVSGGVLSRNGHLNVGASSATNVHVENARLEGAAVAASAHDHGRVTLTNCDVSPGKDGLVRETSGGVVTLSKAQVDAPQG